MSFASSNIGERASQVLVYVQSALQLEPSQLKKLTERLWAFSALVRQPRKDDRSCNSTPFFDRWDTNSQTSYLTNQDPRYASEQECQRICATLVALLLEAHAIPTPLTEAIKLFENVIGRTFQPRSLSCVHTQQAISGQDIKVSLSYTTPRLGAYQIPISYILELNQGGRHEHTNIRWMKPLHINYHIRRALRFHLQQAGVPLRGIKNALDKIQVKAYCTGSIPILQIALAVI